MKIVESKAMVYKVQARTHKRNRINKKWLRRYGYREIPRTDVMVVDGVMYAHPYVVAMLNALSDRSLGCMVR